MLPLARRAVLFLVGGALSYAINVCVFDLMTGGLHWPRAVAEWLGTAVQITGGAGWSPPAAYAVSLSVVTLLGFLWSYHINFPTPHVWHKCAPKYMTTVLACAAANFTIVQILLMMFPERERIAILIGMAASAVAKFLLYSIWVFPSGQRLAREGS